MGVNLNMDNPQRFKFWCQKVLPLVYDDSLSYYEVLCKLTKYMNGLVEDMQHLTEEWQVELAEWLDKNGMGVVDAWLATNGKEAIGEWLAAHPEYTTTVMDGSITEEKLNPSLIIKEQMKTIEPCFYPYNTKFVSREVIESFTPSETVFANIAFNTEDVYNYIYEPLRMANPDYITRKSVATYHQIGAMKTVSGTVNGVADTPIQFPRSIADGKELMVYEFTPYDYEQVIILQAGVHHTEIDGIYGLARLIDYIVNHWEENEGLAYLRWKCKLVVCPVVNITGLNEMSYYLNTVDKLNIDGKQYYNLGAYANTTGHRTNSNDCGLNGAIYVGKDGNIYVDNNASEVAGLLKWYDQYRFTVSCFFDYHTTASQSYNTFGYYYAGIRGAPINYDLMLSIMGSLFEINVGRAMTNNDLHLNAEPEAYRTFVFYARNYLHCACATVEHTDYIWNIDPTADEKGSARNLNMAIQYYATVLIQHAIRRFDRIISEHSDEERRKIPESSSYTQPASTRIRSYYDMDAMLRCGTYGVLNRSDAYHVYNSPTTQLFRLFIENNSGRSESARNGLGRFVWAYESSPDVFHITQILVDAAGNKYSRTIAFIPQYNYNSDVYNNALPTVQLVDPYDSQTKTYYKLATIDTSAEEYNVTPWVRDGIIRNQKTVTTDSNGAATIITATDNAEFISCVCGLVDNNQSYLLATPHMSVVSVPPDVVKVKVIARNTGDTYANRDVKIIYYYRQYQATVSETLPENPL